MQRTSSRQNIAVAELAITLPVILLLTLIMVNLSMVWIAAIASQDAANYGARQGKISDYDPVDAAVSAAQARVEGTPVGSYVVTASGTASPGEDVNIKVDWTVPNFLGNLITAIGGGGQMNFVGTVLVSFHKDF